jgi:N-acetylglucosaminyl-diphospho-decaprenol L-rhamnosyltransferase
MDQVLYIQTEMSKIEVSVVVVSYNTRPQLQRCLALLTDVAEVIVVDNGSQDGSREMVRAQFPDVKLIANKENLGFGAANNLGADLAVEPLVLYLNSDAYAEPQAISKMAAFFEDETVIAAGGRLLNLDGSLQSSTANALTLWVVFCEQLSLEKIFKKSRLFNSYWNTRRIVDSPEPVDTFQVMGAAMMVRKGKERFDERYFLYCEDTDLCLRLHRHGRIVYLPSCAFVHELGASSSKDPVGGVARYNAGKELFFLIHQGRFARWVCSMLNGLGAFLRALYWTIKSVGRRDALTRCLRDGFWKIILNKSMPRRP